MWIWPSCFLPVGVVDEQIFDLLGVREIDDITPEHMVMLGLIIGLDKPARAGKIVFSREATGMTTAWQGRRDPPTPAAPGRAESWWNMTVIRYRDLVGREVLHCPFQGRKQAFQPVDNGYTMTQRDADLLTHVLGETPDIHRLEITLRLQCGITSGVDLHWLDWPRIMGFLRACVVVQETGKPDPSEPDLTDEAKALAVLATNPQYYQSFSNLAKDTGITRQRLYEMSKLLKARAAFKEADIKSRLAVKKACSYKDPESGETVIYKK